MNNNELQLVMNSLGQQRRCLTSRHPGKLNDDEKGSTPKATSTLKQIGEEQRKKGGNDHLEKMQKGSWTRLEDGAGHGGDLRGGLGLLHNVVLALGFLLPLLDDVVGDPSEHGGTADASHDSANNGARVAARAVERHVGKRARGERNDD